MRRGGYPGSSGVPSANRHSVGLTDRHAVGAKSPTRRSGNAGDDGNASWWRGIVVLRNVREGDFDLECWSMDRIAATWGDP